MRRSLFVTFTIARVEARLALRSHVWRIALILNCALLLFIRILEQVITRILGGGPRMLRSVAHIHRHAAIGLPSLPSTYPLVSLMYANVFIALSMGIIAAASIARERDLDTNEPVKAKDFSLVAWAAGKTGGLFFAFAVHVAAVLALTLVHALVFEETSPTAAGYLVYPSLVSLPVFAFFTGLGMFLRSVTGSRALTVTAVAAATGLAVVFGSERLLYLFDAFAWGMPVLVSEITGFADLPALLVQRGAFLFAGAAMGGAAWLLMPRPRQSRAAVSFVLAATVVSFALALAMPAARTIDISRGRSLRADMMLASRELAAGPVPAPESYDIEIRHRGSEIAGRTTIVLRNEDPEPLDRYVFNLNPGLRVERVGRATGSKSADGTGNPELGFERRLHLCIITPQHPLAQGARDTIVVSYRGHIEDEACFPGCDEPVRWRASYPYEDWVSSMMSAGARMYAYRMIRFGKRSSFVGDRYVLLPPWSMWYPSPGVIRGSGDPLLERAFFAPYRLAFRSDAAERDARRLPLRDPGGTEGPGGEMPVEEDRVVREKKAGLTLVAQGKTLEERDGWTICETGHPSRDITLLAGEFTVRSVEVDSVGYSLATLTPDGEFMPSFAACADTVPDLIREIRGSTERRIGLTYPLPYMTIAETPVQFHAMKCPLVGNGQGYAQPGLLLLHERGSVEGIESFGVSREESLYSRVVRLGEPLPRRQAAEAFGDLVGHDILRDPACCPIGSFYGAAFHLRSGGCPVLDLALESYYAEGILYELDIDRPTFMNLVPLDEAGAALEGRSLAGIVEDRSSKETAALVVPFKGKELFLRLGSAAGAGRIGPLLESFMEAHRFEAVPDSVFFAAFLDRAGVDAASIVDTWYRSGEQPAFARREPEIFLVVDGDRERCQILVRARNEGTAAGLLRIVLKGSASADMRSGRQRHEEAHHFLFEPGEGKEVGILVDEAPRTVLVSTLLSRNIPAVVQTNVRGIEMRRRTAPFEGERPLPPGTFAPEPDEILVDDLDDGFEVIADPPGGLMRRVFGERDREKYETLLPKEPPDRWTRTVRVECFGRYIRSGMVTAAGRGDGVVRWTARLPGSGRYEVWHHMVDLWWMMTPEHRRKTAVQEYHFTVPHGDGIDRPVIRLCDHEPGWVRLGTYRFEAGEAAVELTDESPRWFIIADAVKFVRVR